MGNDSVYKPSSVSDCVRLQLPVPIRMEGSALFWDRVCVWCRAQSPSSVCPRLHLHPSPRWIYLPVPPGDRGAPLRERLHPWATKPCPYIWFYLDKSFTVRCCNRSVVLPVQPWPSLIRSSAATSHHGCHSRPWVSDTGPSCSCSSSLYHPMASFSTPHSISVPELVRVHNSLFKACFCVCWRVLGCDQDLLTYLSVLATMGHMTQLFFVTNGSVKKIEIVETLHLPWFSAHVENILLVSSEKRYCATLASYCALIAPICELKIHVFDIQVF